MSTEMVKAAQDVAAGSGWEVAGVAFALLSFAGLIMWRLIVALINEKKRSYDEALAQQKKEMSAHEEKISSELTAHKDKVRASFDAYADRNEQVCEAAKKDLESQKNRINGHSKAIDEIRSSVIQHSYILENQQKDVDRIETNMKEIKQDISDMKKELKTDINSIRDDISSMGQKIVLALSKKDG